MQEYPSDCCPDRCYARFPCLGGDHESPFWQGWGSLRIKTFRLIENKYFETAVIAMILISSMALVSAPIKSPAFGLNVAGMNLFSGPRGRQPEVQSRAARRPLLHGPNLHRHFLPGDVRQVAGPGLRQVLHQRLVLARLCHRHGETIATLFNFRNSLPVYQ